MAKSSRLPSPEEYGKAVGGRQSIVSDISRIAEGLSNLRSAASDSGVKVYIDPERMFDIVSKTVEAIKILAGEADRQSVAIQGQVDSLSGELRQSLATAETVLRDEAAKALRSAGEQMKIELRNSIPKREPRQAKVDLTGIQRTLDALVARPVAKQESVERLIGPSSLTLQISGRDENGDIETVDVEVKH